MTHPDKAVLVPVALFWVLGFLIMLHQFLYWGVWFQREDLHHETFILACFSAALGILMGTGITRRLSEQAEKEKAKQSTRSISC